MQLIKNMDLNIEFPGWKRLENYLNNVWPFSVQNNFLTKNSPPPPYIMHIHWNTRKAAVPLKNWQNS